MPNSFLDESLEATVSLETETAPLPDDLPFRILMLGDWGGSSDFSKKDLSVRKPIEIDRDEFDDVIRKIRPEITLKFEGNENNFLRLTFESLDDFHPDSIFQRVSLFSDLRDIRQKLKQSDTFNEAAREVRSWYVNPVTESISQDAEGSVLSNELPSESGNLLDQILNNQHEATPIAQTALKSPLSEFVGNIISPHIVKNNFEQQSELLAVVDEIISDLMRKIFHHKAFQELESAWRGLNFLVRRVETSTKLKIALFQLQKDELLDNLSSVNDLAESEFYKLLIEKASTTESWAVVCGNYKFSPTVEDTAALVRIARISQSADCPFVSQVNPTIFGAESFATFSDVNNWKISPDSSEYKLWTALRSLPESSYLGFALPGFIGRLPYGFDTEPTETFSFEEFINEPFHDDYLWINPCFAYGYALAKEYSSNEWNINQDISFDIENLPLHLYQSEGVTKTKSCAEIEIRENFYNAVIQQGLMILISFRDTDIVRLSALRSIALESSVLKGRWRS